MALQPFQENIDVLIAAEKDNRFIARERPQPRVRGAEILEQRPTYALTLAVRW